MSKIRKIVLRRVIDFRFFAVLRMTGFEVIVREGAETLPYELNIKLSSNV